MKVFAATMRWSYFKTDLECDAHFGRAGARASACGNHQVVIFQIHLEFDAHFGRAGAHVGVCSNHQVVIFQN